MIKTPEDMIAGTKYVTEKYGELEIVEYRKWNNVLVRFITTGYESVVQANNVRRGAVKDLLTPRVYGVGYFGVGKFSCKNTEKIYHVWHAMLARCYCEKTQLKRPTYIGCSVSPEWRNLQVFGEWYEANYPKDGIEYHLDKDIKVTGNRVYSPETCLFVSHAENTVAAKAKTYMLLTPKNKRRVLVYNLREFCRKVGATQSNMTKVVNGDRKHHLGWTLAPLIKT